MEGVSWLTAIELAVPVFVKDNSLCADEEQRGMPG